MSDIKNKSSLAEQAMRLGEELRVMQEDCSMSKKDMQALIQRVDSFIQQCRKRDAYAVIRKFDSALEGVWRLACSSFMGGNRNFVPVLSNMLKYFSHLNLDMRYLIPSDSLNGHESLAHLEGTKLAEHALNFIRRNELYLNYRVINGKGDYGYESIYSSYLNKIVESGQCSSTAVLELVDEMLDLKFGDPVFTPAPKAINMLFEQAVNSPNPEHRANYRQFIADNEARIIYGVDDGANYSYTKGFIAAVELGMFDMAQHFLDNHQSFFTGPALTVLIDNRDKLDQDESFRKRIIGKPMLFIRDALQRGELIAPEGFEPQLEKVGEVLDTYKGDFSSIRPEWLTEFLRNTEVPQKFYDKFDQYPALREIFEQFDSYHTRRAITAFEI
ncbi:hypothetical protein HNP46_005699 [Pseudomonas nitritireducens]|uniref:Uncharacterized protein n=1 Tax=Pseudomonas nitroreducens TaxID=46680 RepID=A0A7W7KQ12_PSENT|nr:hypothetical protein [Pseudomonas nitritireducens]MBB4866792.1 hypothetical protein [Pseudomonas nitritireducens]